MEELLRALSLSTSALAARLRQVFESPVVRAKIITATIPIGGTSVSVSHGLGRAFRGACIAGSSAAVALVVDLPGRDADRYLIVRASAAVAAATTVNVLVY
jgi:hypothetical protein